MALKFLKHKWHKTTLIGTGVFVVLLFIAAFVINSYWSPVLSSKVKDAVIKATDSLYSVDFSDADLHVLEGRVLFYNVTLKIDTPVYNRLKARGLAPNNLFSVHVKRLILSHIHPFKLYFNHVVDIDRISLTSPDVQLSYQLNHTKDTVNKDHRTIWQKISKSIKYIHVGDILLNDIKFKYKNYSGNKLAVSELKEMNLQANDLLIDSATQTDKSRLMYCKNIIADLNDYKGTTADGLYKFKIKQLKLSTQISQLMVHGATFEPVNPLTFFGKTLQDRFAFGIDSLWLNNFDYLNYHKYRIINASSLVVKGCDFSLFNNPGKPKTFKDKINSFPNVAIYQVNARVKIDTIRLKHVNVTYSEHNKKSNMDGSIYFNNTSGTILNATNNKEALQKNNLMRISLNSYFMNRGNFSTTFVLNLTDPDAAYSYTAHMGPMDLSVVNTALMPFAQVKITNGTLKSLDFKFDANRRRSKGTVTVLYNNLKVKLLKTDTVHSTLRGKMVASLFANIFILKHDNPDAPGLIPRSFHIDMKRQPNFSFFKAIWQSLLQGLKPSVGYDKKTQKATSERMAQSELKKKNRQTKKEQRQARRAERKLKRKLKKERKEAEKAAEAKQ
ncbi:hypothetical protein ACFS5N_18695 [Mucilaginibacter ximonensis]|uniref:AsmA-like protein n=1 Tax=Mucilaginibacter ximonensis TaxID=538021 RepID=A0ABW5YHK0_9SPHI